MPADRALDLFRAVAAHHGQAWKFDQSPKFGANALRVNGKIYAALTRRHRLLLKLPPAHVAELLASRHAAPMESGGRVMRGWVTLPPDSVESWIALSDEARKYVAAATKPRRKSP